MKINWIEGFCIKIDANENEVVISANKEGLLSLAEICNTLASSDIKGEHVHLDQYNSLEDDSVELIISKS